LAYVHGCLRQEGYVDQALGELIGETATRYIYRNLAGTAFVSKSSSIHLAPCPVCSDYQQSEEAA
jgi:hypothetical protein